MTEDGVFYSLALTFGTLLSSQGTDASFVLTLSGFPPGASLRCFQPYQIRFPVSPLLNEAVGPNSVSGPLLERGFAFQLSLSGGDPDFIRSIRSGFPTAI
ncbi:hypothetical protein [Streptomyces roseifaciens]|uniref:hypothetical protein n=1 Tax=Streptomyces roseifaciens TaxID=1488406 RepID=UPI00099F6F35|nr:hypothetical protein [Streptomyces roseifaciens]